ncbi:hypothetical protein EIN_084990 [Entamoeba invadens IP1]|uniref:hypothetical protein n=1 Tax=Entamoeba invadens IP1 TaxID=370355 RepID=UPI0002C3EBEA|nr:hypothetical protein EIN_084990 [Entamoeba invadens IP1]ELP85287.1 hypothetical protein EIN_084990 [Entamoeba invadens IP1]|eukprot:XP_004184633.1 hypothetical protein EIN_084990 [Entamoeba invadens IP1]
MSNRLFQLLTCNQTPEVAQQQVAFQNQRLNQTLPQVISIIQAPEVLQNIGLLNKVLIFFKNCLTSKNPEVVAQKKSEWNSFQNDVKQGVHNLLIQYLLQGPKEIFNNLSEVIAVIASYDIPSLVWPDLIDVLVNDTNTISIQNACLKICSLLFEKIDEHIMQSYLPKILSRLTADMNNTHMYLTKLEGIKNLLNYRAFSYTHFNNIFDIIIVIQPIDTEESLSLKIEALDIIVNKLYDKLTSQNQRITEFLINAVNKFGKDQDFLKKVYDVWNTIGEVESEPERTRKSQNIMLESLSVLFKQILEVIQLFGNDIIEDDDDEGEDQNNVIYSAQSIVMNQVIIGKDGFAKEVLTLIAQFLQQNEPGKQYIGLILFSAVLEGGCSLEAIVKQLIVQSIRLYTTSQVSLVKLAASKSVIKAMENVPQIVDDALVDTLLQSAIVGCKSNNTAYVVSSCLIIGYVYKTVEIPNALKKEVQNVCQILLQFLRTDDERIQRTALQSLKRVISNLDKVQGEQIAAGCMQTLLEGIPTLENQKKMKAIGICLEILGSCYENLAPYIVKTPDQFKLQNNMQVLLRYLSNTDTYDSSMKAIICLASVLGEKFSVFISPVVSQLIVLMKDFSQSEIIGETCNIIEQLSIASRTAMIPFVEPLLGQLIQALMAPSMDYKIKFKVIRAISGLALGVGYQNFSKYTENVLQMLQQITQNLLNIQIDLNDEDGAEFFENMMESVLVCYTRLFKGANQTVLNHMVLPVQLTQSIFDVLGNGSGHVDSDTIYCAICSFFMCLSELQFINQNPTLKQQIFNPKVLSVITSCRNNTENPEKAVIVNTLCQKLGL